MDVGESIGGEVVKGVGGLLKDLAKEPVKQGKLIITGSSAPNNNKPDIKQLRQNEAGVKESIPSVQAIIKQQQEAEYFRKQQEQAVKKRFEGGMKEVKKQNKPAPLPTGTSKKPGLFTGKSNVKTSDQLYNQG